jgi:hypothetical protein
MLAGRGLSLASGVATYSAEIWLGATSFSGSATAGLGSATTATAEAGEGELGSARGRTEPTSARARGVMASERVWVW